MTSTARKFAEGDLRDRRMRSPRPVTWALLSGRGLEFRWSPDSLATYISRTVQPDLWGSVEHEVDPAYSGTSWSLHGPVTLVEPAKVMRGGGRLVRGAKEILGALSITDPDTDRFADLRRPVAILGECDDRTGMIAPLQASSAANLTAAWVRWARAAEVPIPPAVR